MSTSLNEAVSALTITRLPGLTQSQALALLRHYGSAEAALADKGTENQKWAAVLADKAGRSAAYDRARCEADYCEEHGIRILPLSHPDYPILLADCADAPSVLFYRGTANLNRMHLLSVVGTRRITDYGKKLCRELCAELGQVLPDVLVVSGLAYGVDVHAHRGALDAGLETVAVLAHGLDRIYPPLHKRTADEMVRQGGLLTEYFTGTNPDKGNFVRRNRIVAGMTAATLVVESGAHGGSLITARLANDYGREVLAFPGRITDEFSAGCNKLIARNDAHLVTSAADVLRQLNWDSAERKPKEPVLFPELELSPEAQRVLEALRGTDGLSQNQLIELTHIEARKMASTLTMLQMEGVVRSLSGANVFALA